MFPHVVAHDWELPFHQGAILVRGRSNLKLSAAVQSEPGPARAKAFCPSIIKRSLKLVERAKRLGDGLGECARGFAAAIGLHNLPEHAVIRMSAAVVAHCCANVFWHFVDA